MLNFPNGNPFTTSIQEYVYAPVLDDTDNRIQVAVRFNSSELVFTAILDTGAPYVICAPQAALASGFEHAMALDTGRMYIRGALIDCSIVRMPVTILATSGPDVDVNATVYVPRSTEQWPEAFPSFIGMTGMLERIHFGFTPENDEFHFGSPGQTTLI